MKISDNTEEIFSFNTQVIPVQKRYLLPRLTLHRSLTIVLISLTLGALTGSAFRDEPGSLPAVPTVTPELTVSTTTTSTTRRVYRKAIVAPSPSVRRTPVPRITLTAKVTHRVTPTPTVSPTPTPTASPTNTSTEPPTTEAPPTSTEGS